MAISVGTAGAIQQPAPTSGTGGQGVSYPPTFTIQGRLKLSNGTTTVEEALRAILETSPGERAMLPGYGARIGEFEPANLSRVVAKFRKDVADYEPRVDTVDATPDYGPGAGEVSLSIVYTLVGDATERTLTYPLFTGPA